MSNRSANTTAVVAFLLCSSFPALSAHADETKIIRVGPIKAPAPWFSEIKTRSEGVTVTVSERDGARIENYKHSDLISSITGRFTVPEATSPKEAAEAYLREHADDFAIRSDLGDLRILFERIGKHESRFDYQRLFEGVPVFKHHLSVIVTNPNTITRVGSADIHVPQGFDVTPRLTLEDAKRIARVEFSKGIRAVHGEINLSSEPDAKNRVLKQPLHEFGILVRDGEPCAVWRIELFNTASTGAWEVFLDDHTQQILHVTDLVEWG